MLLFPEQHDEAELCVMPLTWLMPGMVCLCLSYPLFAMLQGIGRASAPLKITAAGTLVKLVGNVLLIPEMGLTGAAVSTTISFAVILFAAAAVYCRASGLRPEFTPFLAVLYAGGMCGVPGVQPCGKGRTSAFVVAYFRYISRRDRLPCDCIHSFQHKKRERPFAKAFSEIVLIRFVHKSSHK